MRLCLQREAFPDCPGIRPGACLRAGTAESGAYRLSGPYREMAGSMCFFMSSILSRASGRKVEAIAMTVSFRLST